MNTGYDTFKKLFEQRDWEIAIDQFERSKGFLSRATTPNLREFIIRRMNEIKWRYPQHIKEEIPER